MMNEVREKKTRIIRTTAAAGREHTEDPKDRDRGAEKDPKHNIAALRRGNNCLLRALL